MLLLFAAYLLLAEIKKLGIPIQAVGFGYYFESTGIVVWGRCDSRCHHRPNDRVSRNPYASGTWLSHYRVVSIAVECPAVAVYIKLGANRSYGRRTMRNPPTIGYTEPIPHDCHPVSSWWNYYTLLVLFTFLRISHIAGHYAYNVIMSDYK